MFKVCLGIFHHYERQVNETFNTVVVLPGNKTFIG